MTARTYYCSLAVVLASIVYGFNATTLDSNDSTRRLTAQNAYFYLGDSISEKIYEYGLIPLLNCKIKDPNILVEVESNNKTGFICYPDGLNQPSTRIGKGNDVFL